MDMVEIIDMVNGTSDRTRFTVVLSDLFQSCGFIPVQEGEYYHTEKCDSMYDTWCFDNKDEIIGFLFDRDLIGWKVSGFNFYYQDHGYT